MTQLPPSLEKHPELDTWVRIDEAETVTVFSGKSEHGQGLRSMLARIAAEELDVALERVRVATADTAHGLDEGLTAGSTSTQESGAALRQAAAEARAHLLELGAADLGADPAELRVDDGTISAGRSTTTYWRLLGGRRFGVRASGRARPKPPAEHRIVGNAGRRVDLTGIVTGTTRYLQDLSLPGMLHGRVVRPPSRSACLEHIDEARVRSLPGVVAVVRDGSFLGVVGEREEQALAAAAVLASSVRWSEQPALRPLASVSDWLRSQPGRAFRVVEGVGIDADVPPVTEPTGAARTVRATYTRPFTLHGSIGPSAAVAHWHDGGLEVWSSTQGVFFLRRALAEALRVEPDTVRVRHVEAAGCYGHNGADDAAADAALLSQAVGKPVRVQWMRQDEHVWEPLGPAMVMEVRGGLDQAGNVVAWDFQGWTPTHSSRPNGSAGSLLAGTLTGNASGTPNQSGADRNANHTYNFKNNRVVVHWLRSSPLRASALRGLGSPQNTFANESFIDELATAAGIDPIEFRLRHLNDARAKAVLAVVAKRAGWPNREPSQQTGVKSGRGVAFVQYDRTEAYVAAVTDVDVNLANGEVRVKRVVIAHDCGLIINPNGLRNQIEGNVIQATSRALKEEVKFDRAKVTSLDWALYPILRFPEIPDVIVELIDRPDQLAVGAGEATTSAIPAAIANAIFDATGVRLRDVPFTPERIKTALSQSA
jgi:CO/xanthine dehydrogenase Mo-binding subunit